MTTGRPREIVLIRRLHRLRSTPVSRAIAIVAILTAVALGVAACGASPRRVLKVDALTRQGLVVGDQVRIAGVATGRVSGLSRHVLASGGTGWRIELALDLSARRLPVDTAAELCPRSSVRRAAYIELRPGRALQVLLDGGTLPVWQTSTPRVC